MTPIPRVILVRISVDNRFKLTRAAPPSSATRA
jgi:hypothetical protein